jgi:hypothetical protein
MSGHRQQWADLSPGVTWHGDLDDFVRLVSCVGMHCTCRAPAHLPGERGACGAHELLSEQHTLDHLVFARGMRQHFLAAEWSSEPVDSRPLRSVGGTLCDGRNARRRPPREATLKLVAVSLAALLVLCGIGSVAQPTGSTLNPTIGSWQSR